MYHLVGCTHRHSSRLRTLRTTFLDAQSALRLFSHSSMNAFSNYLQNLDGVLVGNLHSFTIPEDGA